MDISISVMRSVTVSYLYSNDLLKLLFTRQCYCAPSLINSALSPEISLLLVCHLFPLSSAFKVKCSAFHFSPSLLLQSSCHLPCTNCAHIPAGFRCKSYLNLSPAAMHTVREMDENGPPGYCCNLQNEHEFALWNSRAWTWATS